MRLSVYVETGRKRVYAGLLAWPGWDRGGRDEAAALRALVEAGPRYRRALGRVAADLTPPDDIAMLEVVEHPRGNGTTDFGVPAVGPSTDEAAVDQADLGRLVAILRAAWAALDAAGEAATGHRLRKGPRGGGRELEGIVEHVVGAEVSYLFSLGGTRREAPQPGDRAALADERAAAVEALSARARGEPVDMGRRRARIWTPRYFVRRAAWHVLDHAWEIEDRTLP
ncbi:MAG: hypothetical protein H0V87_07370 [Chloroflexi bacterium]|nr:hypothetical protein [Chloroflexota bacterium]